MLFRRASVRYGRTPEAETPFQKAAQVWDERIGSARVQARTWTDVETPFGKVRVKVSSEGYYAPEYEDCRKLALESGVALKHIIAEANFAYLNRSK